MRHDEHFPMPQKNPRSRLYLRLLESVFTLLACNADAMLSLEKPFSVLLLKMKEIGFSQLKSNIGCLIILIEASTPHSSYSYWGNIDIILNIFYDY